MNKDDLIFYGMKPSVDNITFLDYPMPTGHAVTVYFTGCSNGCPNCHNPHLQKSGKVYDQMTYDEFVSELHDVLRRARTDRVVLMGGDPLFEQNREFTKYLIENNNGILFCVYTGYDWDYASEWAYGAVFIKCGPYREDLKQESCKTDSYMQFSSKNQELYTLDFDSSYVKVSYNGRVSFND